MNFSSIKAKYIALTLLLVWVLSVMYMTLSMNSATGGESARSADLVKTELLEKALHELDVIRKENRRLMDEVHASRIKSKFDMKKLEQQKPAKYNRAIEKIEVIKSVTEPSKEHEILRRRVVTDVTEAWYYLRNQLDMLKKVSAGEAMEKVDLLKDNMFEYYSITSNDLEDLGSVNGMEDWRLKESQDLADIVQSVITKLQNPKNCTDSRLLLCNLSKGCGFGCQVHHVAYCMVTALATNRTFVLNSRHWRYLDNGWNKFFLPTSTVCSDKHAANPVYWACLRLAHTGVENVKTVQLPIIDTISPRPDFLPLTVPKQLVDRLVRLHGDPFVWWIGQILGYLMRPQPHLQSVIKDNERKLGFANGQNVVGVHIRRTDKVASEAAFHGLDEYMVHVEKYFDRIDLKAGSSSPVERSIYLATDDPGVFAEAAEKYPKYTIIGNKQFSETASLNSRYSEASLEAVILDVHFLSRCDYLVCTFSSQVCRLAYELMQTLHGDASRRFTSLDDIYYFGGQLGHTQIARLNHKAQDGSQLSFSKGESIGVAGNHWDGFSLGTISSTRDKGLYPSYKVLERVDTANFPIFDDFFSSPAKLLDEDGHLKQAGDVYGVKEPSDVKVFDPNSKKFIFIPAGTKERDADKVQNKEEEIQKKDSLSVQENDRVVKDLIVN